MFAQPTASSVSTQLKRLHSPIGTGHSARGQTETKQAKRAAKTLLVLEFGLKERFHFNDAERSDMESTGYPRLYLLPVLMLDYLNGNPGSTWSSWNAAAIVFGSQSRENYTMYITAWLSTTCSDDWMRELAS
jgi:hypothetical protein